MEIDLVFIEVSKICRLTSKSPNSSVEEIRSISLKDIIKLSNILYLLTPPLLPTGLLLV